MRVLTDQEIMRAWWRGVAGEADLATVPAERAIAIGREIEKQVAIRLQEAKPPARSGFAGVFWKYWRQYRKYGASRRESFKHAWRLARQACGTSAAK